MVLVNSNPVCHIDHMQTLLRADKPAERVYMWYGVCQWQRNAPNSLTATTAQSEVPLQHAADHNGWVLPMQATIMTDPGTADRTYIGPMTPELVEEIIKKVRPIPWRLRAGITPRHSTVAMHAQLAV